MQHQSQKQELQLKVQVLSSEVKIQFIDHGVGVSAEWLSLLGKEGWSFGKKQGTGLGLFFVNQMLTRIDAQVQIESQVGHGTTVTLRVPILLAQSRAASEIA